MLKLYPFTVKQVCLSILPETWYMKHMPLKLHGAWVSYDLAGTIIHFLYHSVLSIAALGLTSGFDQGSYYHQTYWLRNVQCIGNETRLIDCHADSHVPRYSYCRPAGVACAETNCTQGDIRLQGDSADEGRVEICNNNIWGTVCDDFWDNIDAGVACRQLGLPSSSTQ